MSNKIKKICVIGPESTGKSTLCRSLAMHYQTRYIPEIARYYIEHLNRPYTPLDLIKISEAQVNSEYNAIPHSNRLLFCDTNPIVEEIWHEVKFKGTNQFITNTYNPQSYEIYLLTYIDIPWEYDKQREHPEMRSELFDYYHSKIAALKVPFLIIKGDLNQRLNASINFIEAHIN